MVSLSLSGRNIALAANRPLDDLYIFWSSVPRLLIGGLAGLMAPWTLAIFSRFVSGNAPSLDSASQSVLQLLLAFSGGFADRLFFEKLVDSTWQISGLTKTDSKK